MQDYDIDLVLNFLNEQLKTGDVEFRYVVSENQDVLGSGVYLYESGDIAGIHLVREIVDYTLPFIKDLFIEKDNYYYIPKYNLGLVMGTAND